MPLWKSNKTEGYFYRMAFMEYDTPPNSLKDSNVNPKLKTMEEEVVEVRSLVRNILRVRKVCGSSEMRTRTSDKWINYSYRFAQTKQQVG